MNEYTQSAILTATPEKLVQMLYERAIELVNEAIENVENSEVRNSSLTRAQEIVLYLNAVLNMEKGGEIAKNLRALYDFIYRELVDGNVKADREKLKSVKDLLAELLDTWKEVEKRAKVRPAVVQSGGFNASA